MKMCVLTRVIQYSCGIYSFVKFPPAKLFTLDIMYWCCIVGLGPPAGIQLSTGRMLIPSYHTNAFKGDGCVSKGHTLYSDDHGLTWRIGSSSFGEPFMSNECQAVELDNGDVMIAARTISTHRIQIVSHDGGLTFDNPTVVPKEYLQQTIEGCEGSVVSYLSYVYLLLVCWYFTIFRFPYEFVICANRLAIPLQGFYTSLTQTTI